MRPVDKRGGCRANISVKVPRNARVLTKRSKAIALTKGTNNCNLYITVRNRTCRKRALAAGCKRYSRVLISTKRRIGTKSIVTGIKGAKGSAKTRLRLRILISNRCLGPLCFTNANSADRQRLPRINSNNAKGCFSCSVPPRTLTSRRFTTVVTRTRGCLNCPCM